MQKEGVIDLAAPNSGDNDSVSLSITKPGPWGDRTELSRLCSIFSRAAQIEPVIFPVRMKRGGAVRDGANSR